MDTFTGSLYSEQELKEIKRTFGDAFDKSRYVEVSDSEITDKQKQTKQVSKYDNRSKLGKKFTAARFQRKRFWENKQ